MAVKDAFIAELKYEAGLTKKMLEKVPMDKADWKPHEKSMTLGRLATHIAETIHWIPVILQADEFDFASNPSPKGHTAADSEELLMILDNNLNKAITTLSQTDDETFNKTWSVKGENIW